MTQVEYWDKVFEMLSESIIPKGKICRNCEYFKFPVIEIGAGVCGCINSPRYGWWGTEEATCPKHEKLTIHD